MGTFTGTLRASLAMLVGNRLLPEGIAERGRWKETIFWAAWALAFLHAAWRTAPMLQARHSPAWIEQCWAVTGLALAAVG